MMHLLQLLFDNLSKIICKIKISHIANNHKTEYSNNSPNNRKSARLAEPSVQSQSGYSNQSRNPHNVSQDKFADERCGNIEENSHEKTDTTTPTNNTERELNSWLPRIFPHLFPSLTRGKPIKQLATPIRYKVL